MPDEDVKLRALVASHGTSAWEVIAGSLPGRNARQCRERWKHYLSGELSSVSWTPEEDRFLYEKMRSVGPKWTRLATFFPGRTDIQIKTRWMQTFAHVSDLHIKNRTKRMPLFPPTHPVVLPGHIQFAALPQKPSAPPPTNASLPPTPQRDCDCLYSFPRDSSFGSRSFLDFSPWNE